MDKKNESENKKTEEEDSRIYCKYGAKCFQKNPEHHKKYKHPPSIQKKNAENDDKNSKKRKLPEDEETSSTESKTKKQNVVSSPEKVSNSKNAIANTDKVANIKNKITKTNNVSDTENETANTEVSDDKNSTPTSTEDISNSKTLTSPKRVSNTTDIVLNSEENIETSSSNPETDTNSKTDTSNSENLSNTKTESSNSENLLNSKIIAPSSEKVQSTKTASLNIQKKNIDPYSEARKLITKVFLVDMPENFYQFYNFCNELKPSDPSSAFKIADIKLVGPYDVLSGLITKSIAEQNELLTHWRYYYDPPEFQTILKGNDKEGLHFGYWRDRPSSEPVFVATNCSNVSHKIKPVAENVFGALACYLEEKAKKANPFEKTGFFNILGKLKAYAKKNNITLEIQTAKMKSREKNVVARTIHGAGVVCPYNKKSQVGYRELSVTDNQLLKIIKKIDDAKNDQERAGPRVELGEIVRLATIAGDECDFGTCLELGHDLLSTGCTYVQNAALAVLSIAYNQLDRQPFLKIVEAHMENRKKGTNTSALPNTSK